MRRLIDKVALVLSVSMYHVYEVVARIYHTKNNLNNVFIYHLMIKYNNTKPYYEDLRMITYKNWRLTNVSHIYDWFVRIC